jgi:hypothetical protein
MTEAGETTIKGFPNRLKYISWNGIKKARGIPCNAITNPGLSLRFHSRNNPLE